jgi:hypothetical protein
MTTKEPPEKTGNGAKKGSPKEYEYTSTVAVLHQHSMGVSTKEKIFLPFLFLGIGILIVAAALVVRDHMSRSYTTVPSMAKVVELAATPPPETGALAGFVNPDDSRFVQVPVRAWQFWSGNGAVVQDHYIRLSDFEAESVERLVKGSKGGAATLAFQFDLGRTEGDVYKVDKVFRGGMETRELDRTMEIYPLTITNRPGVSSGGTDDTYVQSHGIDHKRENTFKNLDKIAVVGLLQQQDGEYRIHTKQFNVALDMTFSPGFAAMVEDLVGKKVTENMTWYLRLEEKFDWGTKSKPGRRQSAGEIGRAKLDGVLIGKVYIANG